MAQFGGAVRFQRPSGNHGNHLVFDNCTFNRNTAIESDAAIGISMVRSFDFDQDNTPNMTVNW